ncbi:ASCH domain-containing protein [Nonomuraea maritima]|uniref:ASCH domain-containing protein n=1 Tax=Nonomuraea maritima TaxID=683260 RepID=UPI0037189B13
MITIQQPWAALIVAGIKDIENRTWTTAYQGPLLIQAGIKIDRRGLRRLDELGLELDAPLHRGVILGSVHLGEITRSSASPWARPYAQHWKLSDPQPVVRLLEARGQQGRLFDPPPDWRRAFTEHDAGTTRLSRVRDVPADEVAPRFREKVTPEAALLAALNGG